MGQEGAGGKGQGAKWQSSKVAKWQVALYLPPATCHLPLCYFYLFSIRTLLTEATVTANWGDSPKNKVVVPLAVPLT